MLSVHEVATAYQGLVAISAVSIEVAKGEIVCVAGANGAGKSTLLKSIAGAERPRSGTVSFDGAHLRHVAACHHPARHRLCAGEPPLVFAAVAARHSAPRQL